MEGNPVEIACRAVGGPTELARRLGVSVGAVHQWRVGTVKLGGRRVPVERAVEMEFVTGGAVRRWQFRPDSWHRIWPELVGVPGAPDVPSREAV